MRFEPLIPVLRGSSPIVPGLAETAEYGRVRPTCGFRSTRASVATSFAASVAFGLEGLPCLAIFSVGWTVKGLGITNVVILAAGLTLEFLFSDKCANAYQNFAARSALFGEAFASAVPTAQMAVTIDTDIFQDMLLSESWAELPSLLRILDAR